MNRYVKILLVIVGAIFILFGFIGLFFPILQGILFIAIGVYVLSLASSRFKGATQTVLARFPRLQALYEAAKTKIENFFKKKGTKSEP